LRRPSEIHDGIYLIGGSGLTGGGDCLFYLIRTSAGLVLIDCGLGENINRVINNIKALDLDPEDLKALIITHCHIDHIGAAAELKKRFKLETYAHKYDVPAIEGEKLVMTGATMYGVDYEPVKVDHIITVEKGEETFDFGNYELVCVHIPGHTPGSICVYTDVKKTRVLFAQDVHGPLFDAFGSNTADFVESLKRMKKINADIMCEGHFGIYQPASEVKKYIEGYIRQFSRRL
jgi:glyoxylase-like metal-dependent hydrolase (beta-lactamase superfamily II)